ncbi:hypothetical protein TWF506_001797 [Arthrobotrys conoides]|uniref:Uncharacterized protein n=1 Tax=Arthrobotrys conoides TaxID=74498 RepID=A0AAN8NY56_9PEZI
MHLRRAITPSYTLVYSGVRRVPDFDDCIDYTTFENPGTYSTVAKECASTANSPATGAKFFAVYQTDDQKGTNFWWCGWWDTAVSDMADVLETYQKDGDAIYKAYGYNFSSTTGTLTSSSLSVKGASSSASIKSATSTLASVKGNALTSASVRGNTSTSNSAKGAASTSGSSTTPMVNTSKSDSTSVVKNASSTTDVKSSPTTSKTSSTSSKNSSGSSTPSSAGTGSATSTLRSDLTPTPTTLAKKASSTGSSSSLAGVVSSSIGKASSSSGKAPSAALSAATTSKAGTSSSGSQATGRLSTQTAPTGVTTVTYAATATGIAGFSFVTGAVSAIPSQNILNYWISDGDPNAKYPQVSCANHCSSDSSCESLQSGSNKPGLTVQFTPSPLPLQF